MQRSVARFARQCAERVNIGISSRLERCNLSTRRGLQQRTRQRWIVTAATDSLGSRQHRPIARDAAGTQRGILARRRVAHSEITAEETQIFSAHSRKLPRNQRSPDALDMLLYSPAIRQQLSAWTRRFAFHSPAEFQSDSGEPSAPLASTASALRLRASSWRSLKRRRRVC